MPETAVVLLNWNGLNHLKTFLPSVVKHSASATIYLADNASTDNSLEWVKENYPAIKIVKNKGNTGYAGGYNQALQHITADYYVLLNTDVEVTENWIEPVIQLFENDSSIAACQPKVKSYQQKQYFEHAGAAGGYMDYLGFPFCKGRMFDTLEEDKGQYNASGEVFWGTGACLFIRADAFHNAGGLDARFFAHMEEIDLCWRLKNKDQKIYYCAESTIYHLGGGTLAYLNPKKTFLNFRNSLLMMVKNHTSPWLFFIMIFRLFLDGIAGLKFLLSGHFSHFGAVFKSHVHFYWWLPLYLKERSRIKKLATQPNKTGLYNKSIVLEYFLRKKKVFTELDKNSFY